MKAEQLRKSILQLAIQGKLVPQDPADEPASVLLERIRAEKQRLIKEGKIKKDKGDSVIFKGDDNCYYEKTGSEVKNITDEIPFDIPDTWCWTRLGNLITIISGVSYDKKDVCNNGIRILRGGNVNDLKITTFPEDVFLQHQIVQRPNAIAFHVFGFTHFLFSYSHLVFRKHPVYCRLLLILIFLTHKLVHSYVLLDLYLVLLRHT